jgi:hypothetical protein
LIGGLFAILVLSLPQVDPCSTTRSPRHQRFVYHRERTRRGGCCMTEGGWLESDSELFAKVGEVFTPVAKRSYACSWTTCPRSATRHAGDLPPASPGGNMVPWLVASDVILQPSMGRVLGKPRSLRTIILVHGFSPPGDQLAGRPTARDGAKPTNRPPDRSMRLPLVRRSSGTAGVTAPARARVRGPPRRSRPARRRSRLDGPTARHPH